MTPEETLAVCRIVKAVCPAQKFDEYTPDAWSAILAGVDFVAAQKAIVEVGKRQPWISPSDIIGEVNRAATPVPYHRPIRDVIAEIDARVAAERADLKAIES